MKLTTKIGLLAISMFSLTAFGQREYSCAHLKGQHHSDERSARLSLHQIALTEKYDVHFYKLDIEMERTSTDVDGKVQMHVNVIAPILDSLVFELHEDLFIDDIFMNGVTAIPFTRDESAVIVPVSFVEGDSFFIEVEYSGTPPSGGGPFGGGAMSNDSSPSWGNQVTWSLSEPFGAYEWFPCKQSLTDKIDSSYVFVTTDAANMAGSNGLLTAVVDLPGDKKRYEWKSNYAIDYYLISVAIAEYVEYTIYANPAGSDPVMIQNFIYNNPACLSFFEDDIDETADYLELYSDLYGLYPFHLEKYGHCMAPLGGGMEHQTMTTQGYFVNWLTAHELGHQWFGDNVTCATWADIWLNEGFASYSEELMMEAFYPSDASGWMLDRHNNIMGVAGGSVYVEDSTNVGRIFSGRLTYDKGAAIVHTMRFLINDDDLFFEVLRTYQEIYTDGTARAADFKAVLEDVTGKDFTAYFNEWYYGEGFPTYEIEYTVSGGELIVLLEQDVSMPGVTPYFTNDVEIRVQKAGGGSEVFRLTGIAGEASYHSFEYDADGVVSIVIDPSNWIINDSDGATENANILNLVEETNELEVYPNPAQEQITFINSSNAGFYTVFDALGRNVLKGELLGGENTIDVSALPKGQYILKVAGGQKKFTKL